jgi:medium-chain acyl-[acyl-carrier-protein] hydrolase
MGALIVFEIARLLRRKNAAAPAQLFISGFRAPHLPDLKSPRFDLPDERFIEELKRMNSPGCDSTAHSELLGLMLPTLRADFYLIETYRYDPEPSLACPITVYGGSYDAEVSEQQLREWRQHTSANFAMIMLPGGHFFPQTHTQVLLHEIDRQLSEQVTSRGHARKVDASSITKFPHATE